MYRHAGSAKLAKLREEALVSWPSLQRRRIPQTTATAMQASTSRTLVLTKDPQYGFGFSIRGGAEYGTGIFISHVSEFSDAYAHGLCPGDQLVKVNEKSFLHIYHDDAARYLNSKRRLKLVVFSLGIIPGRKFEQTQYQWVDTYGRPTSPPPPLSPRWTGEASPRGLLHGDDERKVNVVIGEGTKLGLLIRGGAEFGLGIYVAGIDHNSVAGKCGILVGEQIIEVNGISFLKIRHAVAANILRTSKMMTILLKDIGKVPLSKTVYDHTEWVDGSTASRHNHKATQSSKHATVNPVFHPTIAGSQVRHSSVVLGPSTYGLLDDHSKAVLSFSEQGSLRRIIQQYNNGQIPVNTLVLSLLDLLNTNEKLGLVVDVRGIIRPQDIAQFDSMCMKKELHASKHRVFPNRIYLGQDRVLSSPLAGEKPRVSKPTNELHSILRRPGYRETSKADSNSEEPSPGSSRDSNYFSSPVPESKGFSNQPPSVENSPSSTQSSGSMDYDDDHIYAIPNRKKKISKYSVIKLKNGDLEELRDAYGRDIEESVGRSDFPSSNHRTFGEVQNVSGDDSESGDESRSHKSSLSKSSLHFNHNGHSHSPLPSHRDYHEVADRLKSTGFSHMRSSVIHGAGSDENEEISDAEFHDLAIGSRNRPESERLNSPAADGRVLGKSIGDAPSDNLGYAFRFIGDEPLNMADTSVESDALDEDTELNNSEDVAFSSSLFARKKADKSFIKSASLQDYRPALVRNEDSGTIRSRRQKNNIVDLDSLGSTSSLSHDDDDINVTQYQNRAVENQFDTNPSMERRYAQFSVNDILRQEYLPTSSSDHDMFIPSDHFVEIRVDESFLTPEPARHKKGYMVGTLNIQDQYAYEKTLKKADSVPVDDPTYSHYAKPVIMRSPRPEFSIPTSSTGASHWKISNIATDDVAVKNGTAATRKDSANDDAESKDKSLNRKSPATQMAQLFDSKAASLKSNIPHAFRPASDELVDATETAKPSEDPVLRQLRSRQEMRQASAEKIAATPDSTPDLSTFTTNTAHTSAEIKSGSVANKIKSFSIMK